LVSTSRAGRGILFDLETFVSSIVTCISIETST
jgi:hypothetical protein